MARIRTIKPEFFDDPVMVSLPCHVRLFFVGMWNHADDWGVLPDEPERLRLRIMPADEFDAEGAVEALADRGCLRRQIAEDGTRVLVVTNFRKHQRINRPGAPRYGKPETFKSQPIDGGAGHSVSTHCLEVGSRKLELGLELPTSSGSLGLRVIEGGASDESIPEPDPEPEPLSEAEHRHAQAHHLIPQPDLCRFCRQAEVLA